MEFDPAYTYRMPVAFGPLPGPRQTLPGCVPQGTTALVRSFSLKFTTTVDAILEMLPPCFELAGEPVVTVEYTELSDVPWLAGRGYDTFAIKVPVSFNGSKDRARGAFVAVVWENMADPIITGRDDLGYAKIFAELRSSSERHDGHRCTASWDNHVFAELELERIREEQPEATPEQEDVLNFRYVPSIDDSSRPDFSGAVLTPAARPVEIFRLATAAGRIRFVESTWEQLPTFYNIVNVLSSLPILDYRQCYVRLMRRNIENRGQRRLL